MRITILLASSAFFVLSCILPVGLLNGTSFTNHTFVSTRPAASYLPYEVAFWTQSQDKKYAIGITPIYSKSTNGKDLARYFSFNCIDCLSIGRNDCQNPCAHIDHRNFKFDASDPSSFTGFMSFDPQVQHNQLWLTYRQQFGKDNTGFALQLTLPFIHTEYDLQFCVSNDTRSQDHQFELADYFAGCQLMTGSRGCGCEMTTIALQEPLGWGQICGKRTKNGLADIYIALSYTPYNSPQWILSGAIELIFPTNRSSRAKELFEAQIGHRGHWALGLRADMLKRLWTSACSEQTFLDLSAHTRWHYVIKNTERRIFGLKNKGGFPLPWGHYQLLGQFGLPLVLPAANVLAQSVQVKPRQQGELLGSLQLNWRNLNITIGYDAWLKSAEQLRCPQQWCSGTYAMPRSSFAAQLSSFGSDECPFDEYSPDPPEPAFSCSAATNANTICCISDQAGGCSITPQQRDLLAASSPSATTHMIFGTITYRWPWEETTNVIVTTLGGGYEFSSSNAALAQYAFWGNLSFLF